MKTARWILSIAFVGILGGCAGEDGIDLRTEPGDIDKGSEQSSALVEGGDGQNESAAETCPMDRRISGLFDANGQERRGSDCPDARIKAFGKMMDQWIEKEEACENLGGTLLTKLTQDGSLYVHRPGRLECNRISSYYEHAVTRFGRCCRNVADNDSSPGGNDSAP